MTTQDKALLRFLDLKFKNYDYDFRITNPEVVQLHVDCEKMDKNTPSYDEKYASELYKNPKDNLGRFFYSPTGKFEKVIQSAHEKIPFISDNYRFGFAFKNFNYLDHIENQINSLLKDTIGGECEFSAVWDDPRIKITFKGIGYKDGDNFKEKREELEKLVNQKNYTLESYSVAFRYG